MSDDFSPIRPKSVPLSHGEPERQAVGGRGASLITWGLGLALAVGVLAVVFFLVPSWLEQNREARRAAVDRPAAETGSKPDSAAMAEPARPEAEDDALPPYQQLQRQQAREKAQAELKQFVELQIELEENMQVGEWGADAYAEAKSLAARGDEEFVKERFQQAVASYSQAREALAALIERGRSLLKQALADGAAAIEARDPERAEEAFALAETIAPEDPRVAAGKTRAQALPRINTLMREGRNQELAEHWDAAAETYGEVAGLDPDTAGLDDARSRVEEGRRRARVQNLLSRGFSRLDESRFDDARQAFRQALDLDPGNAVAEGALDQVDKRADLARINSLRQRAETAAEAGRWAEAAELYADVLEMDPTIQFAQSGRQSALAQQRTASALAKIMQNPERLSSDSLYQEAGEILARAEQLEPRGAELASRIDSVRAILDTYAKPVPVVLRSDNQTEVTLSTVGSLGSFTEKKLELRPGAYVVKGSRDGCRDIREQIVVRPNMNPVDIRCVETL